MATPRIRTVIFWSHLTIGALAGVVVLIMAATGAVLALKPQILNRIDRQVRVVTPRAGERRAPSTFVEAARAARPGVAAVSMTIDREPTASVSVGMAQGGAVYVDPYSAAVLGTGSEAAERFFRSVENWHRWLAATGDSRATARAITGASNFAFLGLAVTGLYMWWPRKWTPQHTRPILFFKRTATSRARDFNWHNVIGFWCAPAIVVMTFSGVAMSYPWANSLLYRALGSPPPVANDRGPAQAPGRGTAGARERGTPAGNAEVSLDTRQLDRLWARAELQMPSWRVISARFPNRVGAPVAFSVTDGASWNRFARSQLTLDASSAAVRQWQPYDASSIGQRARGWLRFAHTGELGGLVGQLIAGVGCLGGVMLVWTGFALAFRRLLGSALVTRIRDSRTSARTPVAES